MCVSSSDVRSAIGKTEVPASQKQSQLIIKSGSLEHVTWPTKTELKPKRGEITTLLHM